jgi:hypothetical protein
MPDMPGAANLAARRTTLSLWVAALLGLGWGQLSLGVIPIKAYILCVRSAPGRVPSGLPHVLHVLSFVLPFLVVSVASWRLSRSRGWRPLALSVTCSLFLAVGAGGVLGNLLLSHRSWAVVVVPGCWTVSCAAAGMAVAALVCSAVRWRGGLAPILVSAILVTAFSVGGYLLQSLRIPMACVRYDMETVYFMPVALIFWALGAYCGLRSWQEVLSADVK